MEIFFADDTVQKSIREGMGKVIGFGGLFITPQNIRPLTAEINQIATRYNIPDGEEIKWSPDRKSYIYRYLHGSDRTNCYSEILNATKKYDIKSLVIAWDTGRTSLQGDAAFEKCVDFLFERISVQWKKKNNIGIIVADRPSGGRKEEEKFLINFLDRYQRGTEYSLPDNFALNILTTHSHLVRPLQLADLITGITVSMVCGGYKYAKPLFPIIKDTLIRNHLGFIGGTGLKLFPDDLVNLYYWVLNEDCFSKVSLMSGRMLPWNIRPYYTEEMK
ncbi:hypothetical protein Dvar_56460 [Desulfosarcina variabilis str. Montpellier]|uniref:DUF3800 domain-containing protein n=1 Tax=Desulfosarcina variabilis TaxID=2300 RepID=UPI003AFA6E76